MNTPSEETKTPENGNQRRKSIGVGGGSNLAGGKTRRYSVGVTSSRKSIGEEGTIVPNYLRASTGSCHDFCKYGKRHEQSKSAIPVTFKRTAIVKKDILPKTIVPLEKKKTTLKPLSSSKPEIETSVGSVKVTKKDVSLPTKKVQVYTQSSSTNGKTAKDELQELKTFKRSTAVVKSSAGVVHDEGSNGGIRKKDVKAVKKTGVTPKTGFIKKATKVAPSESQSAKASFSRAASLKAVKSQGIKPVSPLKDQNNMRKTEPKQMTSDKVRTKGLNGVEAESEVKPETMEVDFTQSSMELVNPSVSNNSDSFSDKNVVEQESAIIGPVSESAELFSDKEVLEEFIVAESSHSSSDKESLESAALVAPTVSESSESFYDDEVLEDESDYTDDEEAEVSEEGSETETETANVNKMETSATNKIPTKGKTVISQDKDGKAVKLRFRRGKILDIKSENNGPRKLKFAKGRVMEGNEDKQHVSRKRFEKKSVEETKESKTGPESVVLKHQGEQEKRDAQGLLNNVIEETASKLVESRKSKVKALVGAFETVISLQDGKSPST